VLAGHFHDTYGQAVANALAAYDLGLRTFDSSVGGLGGCPYSPGARGNLSTEDIVYAFEEMGIATGVNLQELSEIGHWINASIGKPNSSRAGAALYSRRHNLQQKSPQSQTAAGRKANALQPIPKPCPPTPLQPWTLINEDPEYQLFRRGSTAKVVLNRPRNGNALTLTMLRNLTKLFESLSKDLSVFHIILTANGKYFCTGMDLSTGGATAAASERTMKQAQFEGLYRLFEAIDHAPQTTIALINGPTFGGGTGLAFVCDIRLARPDITFTMTEVKLGLCPATISKFVVREWGISIAREAMLSARPVTAQELRHAGVIHALSAPLSTSSAAPSNPADHHQDPLDELLDGYLESYLRHAGPRASTRAKELVAAAWHHTGGGQQDEVIKDVFEWMIAPSDEARIGTEAFRAGKKDIDWDDVYRNLTLAGGRTPEIKPRL
jgi:hydroxymethylglutaryl-CoA lyase